MELLKGDVGWDSLSHGANLGQCIGRLVVRPGNVVKLATLEGAAKLLDEEVIARHVDIPGVPFATDLLHHKIQVAEAKEPPDANILGKL